MYENLPTHLFILCTKLVLSLFVAAEIEGNYKPMREESREERNEAKARTTQHLDPRMIV